MRFKISIINELSNRLEVTDIINNETKSKDAHLNPDQTVLDAKSLYK